MCADAAMNVVKLDSISFVRNGRAILSDVSWCIKDGQHCALLGANGSGKTTLLKIVTGYEWGSGGHVTVLGKRFGRCNLLELRKTIGWVSSGLERRLPPEDAAWRIAASGLDASIGLYRTDEPELRERAVAALAAVGVEGLAEQRYGVLSQGEQQRVLIARALITQPALLILDEPCVGLDPAARAEFLADLQALSTAEDAPTMVLVTHHIEEIGPWVRKVLTLRDGKVLAEGTRDEVLTAPVLSDTFGCPCRVEQSEGHYRLAFEGRLDGAD